MAKEIYPWGHSNRFNDYPTYFKKRFNERVQKISIDAGFTCPNRDGSKGVGGCTYCNNRSFNPEYCTPQKSIAQQVEEGIAFFHEKYKAQKYLPYFQAYSNTYADLEHLKKLYSEALAHPKVVGLVIGTRPDCVSDEVLDYLQQLAEKYYISIEYGIESANDLALQAINRGHTFAEAENTIIRTANRGIHIGAHLVNGLPFDTPKTMLQHAIRVSNLPIDTLKLHQLQILNHTKMAKDFAENPKQFYLFELDEYLHFVVDVIESVNPNIMLERFVNQAPPGWLIAPKWGIKNYQFANLLNNLLKERDTWQGRLYQQ